jgi:hypothetical protein
MSERLQVEPAGGHDYLVQVRENEETIEFRIRATPAVLSQLGVSHGQEMRVVAATAALLTERQLAADLPPVVDLDDVVAAYDDYLGELGGRLS